MVRIVTDSAADFERTELARMGVSCIPLRVAFGDREYFDGQDLSKDQFYDLLLASSENPKTSQASPQVLLDLIDEAKNAGDSIVYISLSSALSGTYQSAVMTGELSEYPEVYVVDSRNATGGQRMLVEHAVWLRDRGLDAAQIVAEVESLRQRITLYACINTMEYLYRGGRISKTVYTVGNLAQIKPIIHVDEQGGIAVPAKAMGMRKGMATLCKRLDAQQPDPAFPMYVMYTNHRQAAEELARQFEAMGYEIPGEHIIQVGAAIGSHIGPDACGMVYVSRE